MNTKNLKNREAVQRARNTGIEEQVKKPASEKEVKDAVKEINPDKNSMNSRG